MLYEVITMVAPIPRIISEIFFDMLDLDFQKMPDIPEVNFSKYTHKDDVIGELTITMKN